MLPHPEPKVLHRLCGDFGSSSKIGYRFETSDNYRDSSSWSHLPCNLKLMSRPQGASPTLSKKRNKCDKRLRVTSTAETESVNWWRGWWISFLLSQERTENIADVVRKMSTIAQRLLSVRSLEFKSLDLLIYTMDLSQSHNVADTLAQFYMSDCKPTTTPLDPSLTLIWTVPRLMKKHKQWLPFHIAKL